MRGFVGVVCLLCCGMYSCWLMYCCCCCCVLLFDCVVVFLLARVCWCSSLLYGVVVLCVGWSVRCVLGIVCCVDVFCVCV